MLNLCFIFFFVSLIDEETNEGKMYDDFSWENFAEL